MKKILQQRNFRYVIFAEILFLTAICLSVGISAGRHVNFVPINGTFQNFNPVRRLLDGQVPYADFQDYLGLGHLYSGGIFTFIFGGDYQASLMAFTFLSNLSYAACITVMAYAVFKNLSFALAVSNIILGVSVFAPKFLASVPFIPNQICSALSTAVNLGNSARFVRGAALPLGCASIICFELALHHWTKNKFVSSHKNMLSLCFSGAVAGCVFAWSNDYGISSWLCILIMVWFAVFSETQKIMRSFLGTAVAGAVSAVSLFVTVTVLTQGNFAGWLTATFGTGNYQSWYYNSNKSFYIYDVDFAPIMLVQAAIVIIYLLLILIKRDRTDRMMRFGIPALMNMAGFCASNEYKLLSGDTAREVALAILFITVILEIIAAASKADKKSYLKAGTIVLSCLLCCGWSAAALYKETVLRTEPVDGEYIAALGGEMTSNITSVKSAAEFLKDDKAFATYASAQEAVNGFYQPSGTDYIIHVLGDDNRKEYLDSFAQGYFKYVSTIQRNYSLWEWWVERANWFFYRELYADWHPVFANSYHLYWQRNSEGESYMHTNNISASAEKTSSNSYKIKVMADKGVNGIADVYIDYAVKKTDGLKSAAVFNTMLRVKPSITTFSSDKQFESNYLRSISKEYIPIYISDGYGEIEIYGCPQADTVLDVNQVSCSRIFTVLNNYAAAKEINYNGELTEIILPATEFNRVIVYNAEKVLINGKEYAIQSVYEDDVNIMFYVETQDAETARKDIRLSDIIKIL
ncbi:MAG: hypothetical protein E7483_01310 [Ruminococcaceae bacterium]|nr:hypothetical protein [Oscillospiraceae bacterium]